ncbi:hypothetical protein HGM15179_020053 [Zosterops borbonicus]|uniref:Uncharacterized protein n=1 Tax=Zosterops borbonicus TaxID=364589 RepID=A0A8K1DAE0_9PASS|nr:hypothetical protein HGM15179_020053 [Zosterops borbonicus]
MTKTFVSMRFDFFQHEKPFAQRTAVVTQIPAHSAAPVPEEVLNSISRKIHKGLIATSGPGEPRAEVPKTDDQCRPRATRKRQNSIVK